jgi:hypothetical protein
LAPCLTPTFSGKKIADLVLNFHTRFTYVAAIHKGNDPTDPNNYRGITITGAVGKVFNRVLSLRLDKFLQDHNIIHESQIGFTKKARTADHLFVINCLINKYCSSKDG